MRPIFALLLLLSALSAEAQSFNEEKTAAVNYIKRVYNASAFEGAKKVEGDNGNYYAVAVTGPTPAADGLSSATQKALLRAQAYAEQGFAEPCIKFEMIETISGPGAGSTTFLFLCETLGDFVLGTLRKKPFDGSRIVSSPAARYVISVVNMENAKFPSSAGMDKVAQMKAKQQVNTLMNGSTITSDMVIRTDNSDKATEVSSTESIREQAMGFINGLELLTTKGLSEGKTTYIYFSRI